MTAAYAFTDYRSQGQMIPYVLVDIATPPAPANLSLFSLYVALSQSSGTALLGENNRLESLNAKTRDWWIRMGQS
ncbi:hypothetical protein B0H21DRAFT_695248 [Amylocystis lapponica]|nr:hypothetical protein B0H21DRAFT_695248 [Amylocystis lapponica]